MKFKTMKRANPQDLSKVLYYPAPVFDVQTGKDELSEEISFASSINQSYVRSVLSNLLKILPSHLQYSDSVNLEKFGIFRLNFKSVRLKKKQTFLLVTSLVQKKSFECPLNLETRFRIQVLYMNKSRNI